MKFEANGHVTYVNIAKVASVGIMKHGGYRDEKPMYSVDVAYGTGSMIQAAYTEDKSIAEDLQKQIGEKIIDEAEKTYLDGFKDGTEYALNLMRIEAKGAEK